MYELLLRDRTNSKPTRRSIPYVLLPIALLVLSPALAFGQSDQVSRRAKGARIYADMCGRCHNARSPAEFSDGDWTTIITHMRTRTMMTGSEARAVAEFMRASNRSSRSRSATGGAPQGSLVGSNGRGTIEVDTLGSLSGKETRRLREFLPTTSVEGN